MTIPCLLCALLLAGAAVSPAVQARERALVVGIDAYLHGTDDGRGGSLRNLRGAENDARLVADALRDAGVHLPERRVLIGARATADAFRQTWREILDESGPGEGIVVAFAGHGGQELELAEPLDERDGSDETLMFWDFDPDRPAVGRIPDDELFAMLEKASAQRVTFVADSCHSGGLTRTLDREMGRSRQGGGSPWDIADGGGMPDAAAGMPAPVKPRAEEWESLRHVTYLTATADESRVVHEILHETRPHGALSVSFAAAVRGAADADGDGSVVRQELEEYVLARVGALSAQKQVPGFLPRSRANDAAPLFRLDLVPFPPGGERETALEPLAVSVIGGELPAGIAGARESDAAMLRFEVQSDEVVVHHGTDEIARLGHGGTGRTADVAAWQRLIDKFRLLDAVDAAYDRTSGPIDIALDCPADDGCGGRQPEGTPLTFGFDRPGGPEAGDFFVLFNLAGSGELQFLYPTRRTDTPSPEPLPYPLPLDVSAPFGRDDIVAGFCRRDPDSLVRLLDSRHGGHAPAPDRFLALSTDHGCQWGRRALFTEGS